MRSVGPESYDTCDAGDIRFSVASHFAASCVWSCTATPDQEGT